MGKISEAIHRYVFCFNKFGKTERVKCYLYDVELGGKPFATIFANDVPQEGERVSVWVNDDFKFYKVKSRVFGVNVPEKWSVWNLYLQPISTLGLDNKE